MAGSSVIDMMVISANETDATALYDEVAEYAKILEDQDRLRYCFCHPAAKTIVVTDEGYRIQFITDHEYEKIPKDRRWAIFETARNTEFRDEYKSIIDGLLNKCDEQVACDAESKKFKINILYMMSNPDAKPALKDFLDEVYQVTGVTPNMIRNHTYVIGDHVCQITCVFKDGWMSDNLYKSSFDGIIIKPETLRAHHIALARVIQRILAERGCSDEKE